MKKKLALLGIIKQNKPVIILDEPFNGLDIEMCRIVRLILLKLKETGKTIIVSSHVLETLTNLCDYIHYLESGNIKYSKPKEDFVALEKKIFSRIENDNTKMINELLNSN
jgi:ABC-2 type transport system ATP-binding protein